MLHVKNMSTVSRQHQKSKTKATKHAIRYDNDNLFQDF